jgi:DNA-binding NtrC family response regulator
MYIELTKAMMQDWDIQAEFNPPEVLRQIENYSPDDFTPQNWNKIMYFKGKALFTMHGSEDAREIALDCIRKAIVEDDFYTLVKCHVLQAVSYYKTDNEDRIRPLLELAVDYAIDSGDYELMIHARCAYLYFLMRQSQFEQAQNQEIRVVDLIKRVPPSYITASAFSTIAGLYINMAKWNIAIKFYKQALEHAEALSLKISQLNLLNNLGSAICRVNNLPQAEKILQQGLTLAQQMGHKQQEFLFTSNLGNLKIQEGQHQEAIQYYDRCMKILENVPQKPPMLLIDMYNNYSLCYWKLKQADESLNYINKAIEIARECGFERDLVQMEVNKTNLLVELGNYDEALTIVKRGVSYYKKAKDLHQLIWVHRSMARIYYLQKNYKKSYATERKLDVITDEYIAEVQRKDVVADVESIKGRAAITNEYSSTEYSKRKIDASHGFIGCGKAYNTVINSALLAAQHQNTSVLILGESGTGKEIIAQMIHKNSLRRNQAFVPVNVGALSPSLVESELFGHTKGAFTGADAPTKGFFLQSDKGTLFLDEITDMPFPVQSKLLRALETRKVTAVGSSRETAYDSRIISATSQDIRAQLSDSQFRLDLFHRLNTIEIVIPPLRERQEDIEPILIHYVKQYATELNKGIPIIDKSLLDLLHEYSFPGNVRELKNIIERMYILSKKPRWDAQLLCEINPFSFSIDGYNPLTEYDEEDAIVRALLKAKGKQKEAALLLNMSEATLSRRIVKYKLQQHTKKTS